MEGSSEIAQFYDGRSVFVTGGTGFVGKILIEKLLRSCPHLDKVYFLLRPSAGKDIPSRYKEFVNNKVKRRFIISEVICNIVANNTGPKRNLTNRVVYLGLNTVPHYGSRETKVIR